MTPLERAARALYERDTDGRFPLHPPGEPLAWVDLTPGSKEPYIDEARAVLTAIREPSEGMLPDPNHTDTTLYRAARLMDDQAISSADTFAAIWQAMIDAALEEG